MKFSFPWLALGIGVLLSLVLLSDTNGNSGVDKLPLLAALLMSEFGLLLTAIAAAVGVRDLIRNGFRKPSVFILIAGNLLLATYFLRTGISLWPGAGGAP